MNRRNFINFFNSTGAAFPEMLRSEREAKRDEDGILNTTAGLEPYTGLWDARRAEHLLRRLTFGAPKSLINQLEGMTLDTATELLFTNQPMPDPPINPATGLTWVDKAYDSTNEGKFRNYLKDWWIGLMVTQQASIVEKMTLFWHNHFVSQMATVADSRYIYKQNSLFRQNALGNIKNLVKAITKDPAMLRYLNGNTNVSGKPNENFARELQELFTIGKGPQIGADNYTNYTEQDIKAAAKVLTGWSDVSASVTLTFNPQKHDTTDKQFSSAYQNTIIKGKTGATAGDIELNDLVDMIFRQQETAKYICRKIYRWFIYYKIDSVIEQNIIVPLANILRTNNFDIKPVLLTLFKSAHFFEENIIGCLIKNPADLIIGSIRELNMNLPSYSLKIEDYYSYMDKFRSNLSTLQMDIMEPPSVAGWPAYYQEPEFHESWINTATLPSRHGITDSLITGFTINGTKYFIDTVELAKSTSKPYDPLILVYELAQNIFPITIKTLQLEFLIYNVLIPGLPDYEWTNAWQDYMANPTNQTKKKIVSDKLNNLVKYILRLSEYQLS